MSRIVVCLSAFVALVGWSCCVSADTSKVSHPSYSMRAGTVAMGPGGSVLTLTGTSLKVSEDKMTAEKGKLTAGGGRLEAKADSVLVSRSPLLKGPSLRTADLTGNVSIVLKIKGEPVIEASAAKGRIDWPNQVMELHGGVSVTTTRVDEQGKPARTAVKGESVRILTADTLSKGQERVQVVVPPPENQRCKQSHDISH